MKNTVFNWERNKARPQIHYLPRILKFLGYNPSPLPKSLRDRLLRERKTLGLTQKTFAKRLGVDPTTLARWEKGKGKPSKKLQRIIAGFLELANRNSIEGVVIQLNLQKRRASSSFVDKLLPDELN